MAAALPTNASVILLRQSTGGIVYTTGGVAALMSAYNTAHGTSYSTSILWYPENGTAKNYPYNWWEYFVLHDGEELYNSSRPLSMLVDEYDVIVFKSCFPASDIVADTGNPDITNPTRKLENYKLQYAAVFSACRLHTNNRFIVWTPAALTESQTSEEDATAMKDFCANWLPTQMIAGDNLTCWDLHSLEVGAGIYMNPAYAVSDTDSHPNASFAATAAQSFFDHLITVLLGDGAPLVEQRGQSQRSSAVSSLIATYGASLPLIQRWMGNG